jgi:hypothetical protein
MNHSQNRRRLLRLLAGAAATLPVLRLADAQAADAPHLSVEDPTAKSLGYVEDAKAAAKDPSFKAGSLCSNCNFFQAAQASGDYAPCMVFAGKAVNKNGWCKSWVKKA